MHCLLALIAVCPTLVLAKTLAAADCQSLEALPIGEHRRVTCVCARKCPKLSCSSEKLSLIEQDSATLIQCKLSLPNCLRSRRRYSEKRESVEVDLVPASPMVPSPKIGVASSRSLFSKCSQNQVKHLPFHHLASTLGVSEHTVHSTVFSEQSG